MPACFTERMIYLSRLMISVRRSAACSLALVSLLYLCVAMPSLHAGELKIERLFGPEIKTGPYKHPARILWFNGDGPARQHNRFIRFALGVSGLGLGLEVLEILLLSGIANP